MWEPITSLHTVQFPLSKCMIQKVGPRRKLAPPKNTSNVHLCLEHSLLSDNCEPTEQLLHNQEQNSSEKVGNQESSLGAERPSTGGATERHCLRFPRTWMQAGAPSGSRAHLQGTAAPQPPAWS